MNTIKWQFLRTPQSIRNNDIINKKQRQQIELVINIIELVTKKKAYLDSVRGGIYKISLFFSVRNINFTFILYRVNPSIK